MDERTDEMLRVGVVGFGRLAQNYYAPVLNQLGPGFRFCVADPLADSRAAAARALRASQSFADYRAMLEQEPLDALIVSTPPSKHLEVWQASRKLSLPVFMEKPFLLADELETIDPQDPAWDQLMIDFNRRFWPAYRQLGRCIANDELGPVRSARFTLHIDTRSWAKVSNHRVLTGEGGVLYDLGSQMLDLVLETFDDSPDEISVRPTSRESTGESIELNVHYSGGLVVGVDLAYGKANRESVIVKGEKATWCLRDPNYLDWVIQNSSSTRRLYRHAGDYLALGYRGLFRSRSMLRYTVSAALNTFFRTLDTGGTFEPGFSAAWRVANHLRTAATSLQEQGS